MKPLSLKLRGAIGIRDGLGLEQVEIDFTRFSPGLIAIIGDNGSGKTTSMGNMQPFRCLPSRDGALATQFYLKDSYRDFSFEVGGHVYRSHILIDGRTGKQEPYLYKDGKPLNDGKTSTYDVEIEKLLGSEEIFFKSVFASQKAKTITSLTAGKRKELFMELLGFQRYELYAQHCKTQADEIETQVATGRGKLAQINESLSKRSIVQEELMNVRMQIIEANGEIDKARVEIDQLAWQVAEGARKIAENKLRGVQVHDLGNEIGVLESRKWKLDRDHEAAVGKIKTSQDDIEADITRKEQVVSHKHDIEQNVIHLQALRLELKGLEERKAELVEVEREESKAEMAYREAKHQFDSMAMRLGSEAVALDKEKADFFRGFKVDLVASSEELLRLERTAGLLDNVPCRSIAGLPEVCQLLVSAMDAREKIGVAKARISELESEDFRLAHGLADILARIKANKDRMESLVPPVNHVVDQFADRKRAIGFDAGQHATVKAEIQSLEGKKWETSLDELRIAEVSIEEKRKALDELKARLIELSSKYHEEAADLDGQAKDKREKWEEVKASLLPFEFQTKHTMLEHTLADLTANEKALQEKRSRLMGDIQFREELIKQLDQASVDAERIETEIKRLLTQLENWRLLQRACSKDGIPALELDAAGPAVSQIANELLASTFGTKFQIAFETTRQSKDGKKQIEDFDIWVYGEQGRKRIEDLSGGEEVWIEAAIRQAIASYLRKQTGRDLSCRWLDESDGPLSGAKAQNYLDMIRISHDSEGYYFTFIVSHRQDLVAQIQQQLRFLPEEHKIEFVY
jgi:exonuclease SbcC